MSHIEITEPEENYSKREKYVPLPSVEEKGVWSKENTERLVSGLEKIPKGLTSTKPTCVCCDGECHHDACCGKISENCKTDCTCHSKPDDTTWVATGDFVVKAGKYPGIEYSKPVERGWEKQLMRLRFGSEDATPDKSFIALESFISSLLLESVEKERERCVQVAEYWSTEIAAEISAQADINLNEVPMFRRACMFVRDEIRKDQAIAVVKTNK